MVYPEEGHGATTWVLYQCNKNVIKFNNEMARTPAGLPAYHMALMPKGVTFQLQIRATFDLCLSPVSLLISCQSTFDTINKGIKSQKNEIAI